MTVEVVMVSVNTVGVLLVAVGLSLTWRRNGTEQAARDAVMAKEQAARDANVAANQDSILEKLDDKETGLQAVNIKVSQQLTNCAHISSTLIEKGKGHDMAIAELKAKHK